MNDLNESLPACTEDGTTVEDLRLELDQSELKQRELLNKMQQLGEEAAELRGVVVALQRQLDVSLAAQEEQHGLQGELKAMQRREEALFKEVEMLRTAETIRETEQCLLQSKLVAAEKKNIELLAKLDGVLNEKGQQANSYFDSAQKIHELLDRLKEAEKGKIEAVAEAEEKKRQTERLEEELRVKEAAATDGEIKLGALAASASEEKVKLEAKVKEQCGALDTLQGALTLKEKEASNLQRQLQDLQRSLEDKEKELEDVKRNAQEDKDEMQKEICVLKDCLEAELTAHKEQLESKEAELDAECEKLQALESKNQILTTERDELSANLDELQVNVKEQVAKREDYKTQCASLMELNKELLTTVKRNEELKKETSNKRASLEAELAALRASEKQLQGQLEDAKVTVDEKDRRLREENRRLDESLQRATLAAELSESTAGRLEKENQSLREEQDIVKAALSRMQADLKSVHGQIGELEKNLGDSRKNEANLQKELNAKEVQLESKEKELVELQSKVNALDTKEKELEAAKANAEATCTRQTETIKKLTSQKQMMEKSQQERTAMQTKENQEVTGKLTVIQGQLEVNMKEVSRLQAEVLDLRVQLQRSEEEKIKSQAQLDVTEAQRDEVRILTEQLKSQTETLNKQHTTEVMECKKKEEALIEQRDREVAAHADLAISAAAMREELSKLKAENHRLSLENGEIREGLHRANTEMAELGMTICNLNSQKEDARENLAWGAARMEELEKEVENREQYMKGLQLENNKLREELAQKETLAETIVELQGQLEEVQSIKDTTREEMEAVKFQMSSENMNSQIQVKVSQNRSGPSFIALMNTAL